MIPVKAVTHRLTIVTLHVIAVTLHVKTVQGGREDRARDGYHS